MTGLPHQKAGMSVDLHLRGNLRRLGEGRGGFLKKRQSLSTILIKKAFQHHQSGNRGASLEKNIRKKSG